MTDLFDAFLSDIANDCVNGHPTPTDWSATNRALDQQEPDRNATQFARVMPEEEGRSGLEAEERRLHGDPWPVWSMSQAEQPPFRSHLDAVRWAEDHDEDLNRYDEEGDDE